MGRQGQLPQKIGNFFWGGGKYHVKFGYFSVIFGQICKIWPFRFSICIFSGKTSCRPKLTELLRLCYCYYFFQFKFNETTFPECISHIDDGGQ